MNTLAAIYKPSLGLLTDLYQLWLTAIGKPEKTHWKRRFTCIFRQNPFRGGFTVAAGLATAIEYLENLHFDQSDLDYFAALKGNDKKPLFDRAFLDYLGRIAIGLRRGCRARRHGGVSLRAAFTRDRPLDTGPTARIGHAEYHQLPNPYRHKGRARGDGRRGRSGDRVRPAPGPWHRRGLIGRPGGVHRRMHGHLERVCRTRFSASP